jgi:hypothetical protein
MPGGRRVNEEKHRAWGNAQIAPVQTGTNSGTNRWFFLEPMECFHGMKREKSLEKE